MPLSYHYDAVSRIVEAKVTGVVSTGELLVYVKSILADDGIEPGFIEVVDFDPVEDFVVKYTEVEPFKALWKQYLQKGCKATIIHAPSDLSFGTLRMFQVVIGLSQEDAADRFIIVRSRDELATRLAGLSA